MKIDKEKRRLRVWIHFCKTEYIHSKQNLMKNICSLISQGVNRSDDLKKKKLAKGVKQYLACTLN